MTVTLLPFYTRLRQSWVRSSCFHRYMVIWSLRHQGEEQRQRSLHPLTLSLACCNGTLETEHHLLHSADLSSAFAHRGLFELLDL